MEDDKKYWLNEFGLRRWQHKTLNYELQREYHWKDSISILKNSVPGGGRPYCGNISFSVFGELDFETSEFCDIKKKYVYGKTLSPEDFEIIDKNYERRKKLENILKK